VHSSQLDLRHQDLGKLGDATEDSNTRRVMSGFENLAGIISNPDFDRIAPAGVRRRGLNLLSLDGGGVKGLFSLIVLEKLMAEVERRDNSHGPRRLPCEYFDLIGGTSTGGLLAIMLGRLQMDVSSCIRAYRNMSNDIFDSSGLLSVFDPVRHGVNFALGEPWFSGDKLETAICETINAHIGVQEREDMEAGNLTAKDARLLSPEAQKTRCFVCAICEGHHKAERIRSYLPINRRGRDTTAYKIWQAGRATSAAPMYFPAIKISDHHYFDGGLFCNNPILEVVREAREEFPGIDIDTIVSIGTGKGVAPEPFAPILNFVASAIGRLTTTEAQHEEFTTSDEFQSVRESYSRFQEEEQLGKIDLSAADKMDEIEKIARKYVDSPEIKRQIRNCAERMTSSPRF
jgi:predicted acylesterase/phospholipase RssA